MDRVALSEYDIRGETCDMTKGGTDGTIRYIQQRQGGTYGDSSSSMEVAVMKVPRQPIYFSN